MENAKMWPSRQIQKDQIFADLKKHNNEVENLPGIEQEQACETLTMQFVASLRREEYYQRVQEKPLTARRADPNSDGFDAERAVAFHMQNNNIEEAAWLVFLMTHFARPATSGWLRLQQVYGRLGEGVWSWETVSSDPDAMIDWLADNWNNIDGQFGNHRKYESLRPDANRSFAQLLHSYLAWIGGEKHQAFFAEMVKKAGNDPEKIFDYFYNTMSVISFGRLAKFDYLSLLGRYNIVPIKAGSAYFSGSTGPVKGARLLFTGADDTHISSSELQVLADRLDGSLNVGMTVMEDALCNWHKSPLNFVHFRG
jgi:hypothetical protein